MGDIQGDYIEDIRDRTRVRVLVSINLETYRETF
jgi:hypothetical protein